MHGGWTYKSILKNSYRNRNPILQLITSNIWKEKSYCISALPHLLWVPGIMHIRKWRMYKSLKIKGWPEPHFEAMYKKCLNERWKKKKIFSCWKMESACFTLKVWIVYQDKGICERVWGVCGLFRGFFLKTSSLVYSWFQEF